MNHRNVFDLVATEFKRASVPCVLIGGFALSFYKYSRHTGDVDFLISEKDASKVKQILKSSGYEQRPSAEAFLQYKSSRGQLMPIDLLLVSQETLDGILKEAKRIKIAGQSFLVPSLEHTVALKLHAVKNNPKVREFTDIPDIINLIRLNDLNIKTKRFKDLCSQYGPDGVYDKIVRGVEGD